MKKKSLFLIIGIIVIIIIIIIAAIGYIYYYSNDISNDNTSCLNPTSNLNIGTGNSNLIVNVIDKQTKDPILNSVVYLGNGFWNCETDNLGKCSINSFPGGSYSLGIYKKGYVRFFNITLQNFGDNIYNIELEKQLSAPEPIVLEGRIIIVTTAKGTMSENNYLKIRDSTGQEYYLFDKVGTNGWCENFVNSKVRINGYKEKGFIGWQHEEEDGIYIESIIKI